MTAAVDVGHTNRLTANDHAVAAEWCLSLRPVCSTGISPVTGIYSGRFKLADYCHETTRLTIGSESRQASTLFDAIIAIGNLAAARNDRLPSWLRA